jgi:hypothetical protein
MATSEKKCPIGFLLYTIREVLELTEIYLPQIWDITQGHV